MTRYPRPADLVEVDCPKCKGSGVIETKPASRYGPDADDELCNGCQGRGGMSRWWAGRYRKEWR